MLTLDFTPTNRKACILKNEQFDFLADKVKHVPDTEPSPGSKRSRGKKKDDEDGDEPAERTRKRTKKKDTESEEDHPGDLVAGDQEADHSGELEDSPHGEETS